MTRLLVATAAAMLIGGVPHAAAQRNVLLLISDNQNQFDCGCYGNHVVQTPHIDQLAGEGVRFEYAFATTASCGPSRAVIYTGLYTHTNGQYGHPHSYHNFRLRDHVQTIFELVQRAGYVTGLIGKAHIHPPEGAIDFQPQISGRDVKQMAAAAAEFIQSAGQRPFLLVLGYNDPHPTSRDGNGWGIRRNENAADAVHYEPRQVIVPSYLPDRPEVREGLAGYYQQISRLDAGIGLALAALRDSGKDQDTLVIFTSDHGSSEPGAMANHYEPGVRVPLIVRNPLGRRPGSVNEAMLTFGDLVPTILDWTGAEGPDYALPGRSLLPILDQPQPAGWDEVAAKRGALRPAGHWNDQEIICRGRRVQVILNEMLILDVDLDEIDDPQVLEKHPGLQRRSGHIGLLGHGSRVEFRNLRVKRL